MDHDVDVGALSLDQELIVDSGKDRTKDLDLKNEDLDLKNEATKATKNYSKTVSSAHRIALKKHYNLSEDEKESKADVLPGVEHCKAGITLLSSPSSSMDQAPKRQTSAIYM